MTLHYSFPVIRHLDDVLPHLEGHPEFIRVDKDGGYTVVNYVFQTSETFPPVDGVAAAVLRECRGLIFDTASGKLLSRRFHKFFNLGEREDTLEVDVGRPHWVLDKLDGSMISPLRVGGGVRWASKMGVTDVSLRAEVFAVSRPEYAALAERCLTDGRTPIFEWTSRDDRIVLDYGPDALTLLAVRDNLTGVYSSREEVLALAAAHGVPAVSAVSTQLRSIGQFVEELRQREDLEGIVLTFADGHMVKVKTDWYVRLHRAKDQIANERRLVDLVLSDRLDDLLPLLPEEDRPRVRKFADAVASDLSEFGCVVRSTLTDARSAGLDRKTFATTVAGCLSPPVRSCCFHLFDEPTEVLILRAYVWGRDFVARHLSSQATLEKARGVLLTARWQEKEE